MRRTKKDIDLNIFECNSIIDFSEILVADHYYNTKNYNAKMMDFGLEEIVKNKYMASYF